MLQVSIVLDAHGARLRELPQLPQLSQRLVDFRARAPLELVQVLPVEELMPRRRTPRLVRRRRPRRAGGGGLRELQGRRKLPSLIQQDGALVRSQLSG